MKYFQFRRPFDSSHRYLSFVNLKEDTIRPAYTHMYNDIDSRAESNVCCYTQQYDAESQVRLVHYTQTQVCLRSAYILTVQHVLYAVRSLHFTSFYMSNEFFDSGEFVLKLNASLNSSLCKSNQRYSIHSIKRIYSEKESRSSSKKKKKKNCVQFYIDCHLSVTSAFVFILFVLLVIYSIQIQKIFDFHSIE